METRIINVSLEEARKWYNSNDKSLKEMALRVFTEEELCPEEFMKIKTFNDAIKFLSLNYATVKQELDCIKDKYIKAVYKLNIIKKALNSNWEPSLIKGNVFCPTIRLYPKDEAYKKARNMNWIVGGDLIIEGKEYTIIGEVSGYFSNYGLCTQSCGYGDVRPTMGLFGCKSMGIVKHMIKYFSKELFDATYMQYNNYKWI